MTAWAMSPAYGERVILGPTQELVYRIVLDLTRDGRRPELTLGRLALLAGRPVSSVHAALGRLRALGLIGCAARMGRRGGHRLWRVTRRAERGIDRARHRVAVARIVRRWYAVAATARGPVAVPLPLPLAYADGDGASSPRLADDRPLPTGGIGSSGDPGPAIPPSSDPDDPYPRRADPRETFDEKMRRYGLGRWIDERKR